MSAYNTLVAASLAYVLLLFGVAFWADRRTARGRTGWLQSPWVYTLSLSVYCTAWTFYGAVGSAARSGLEFLTIYFGPTLVMIGWWGLVRRLVRIGRIQRVTSIADMVSARYGKSPFLAMVVTLLSVTAATPYIALQLQSVTLSVAVFAAASDAAAPVANDGRSGLWVAAGLTLFTILFGTRNLHANERHNGVVIAIALEAVVKLAALLAVGVFVVWGAGGGIGAIARTIAESSIGESRIEPNRWVALTFLSGAAIICLPRMFQVMVVENSDERHLVTAAWAFPAYLLLMSLFVVPIAAVGLTALPPDANPDLFVLTIPLLHGQDGLAMLAFLGGLSSATSMVIVAAIALSTMVSNHLVLPLWLGAHRRGATVSGDMRRMVLLSRRVSIAAVVFLGYLYFRLSGGGGALAAMGIIAFVGVAQILPALIGGLYWRGANRVGAAAGLVLGLAVWVWSLFLPSFGQDAALSAAVLAEGPWGVGWLRPQALFGSAGMDPVVHALVWSLGLNTAGFLLGSLVAFPTPLERVQALQFVRVFDSGGGARGWTRPSADPEDLLVMAQRLLGWTEAQALFQREAAAQGRQGYLPDPTPEFLERLERELSGSVGAAAAHAMMGQIVGGAAVSVEDLMAVADETAQMLEQSSRLAAQKAELTRTARQLRDANAKLTQLSIQKDAFLSQISHELRTPMCSIRSFSEILRDGVGLTGAERERYAGIIHDESIRLTRLLDDILDLGVLENGHVTLNRAPTRLADIIDRAVAATQDRDSHRLAIRRDREAEATTIVTDPDRLAQVFINLIANARKYCLAARPELAIAITRRDDRVEIDFVDNGRGIPAEAQALVFEKFARLEDHGRAGGAGLGLAICREITARLGGAINYVPGQGGAAFRVTLPADLPEPVR